MYFVAGFARIAT